MAYIPDKLGERRRAEGVSQTAREFFEKYCEHADQESGLTLANVNTCADAFGMRSDNAQKYDKELLKAGWIEIVIEGNRTYRRVKAGWQSITERRKTQKNRTLEIDLLNFRNQLDSLLNFRESSYILGELPKFKEKLLNFRKTYKEYFDQPINQQLNQLFDQIASALAAAKRPGNFSDSDDEKPGEGDAGELTKCRLPEDFCVTPAMREWACAFAPNVDLELWTIEFKNFWRELSSRDVKRTSAGWLATWQNRMVKLQSDANENLRRTEVWKQTRPDERSKAEIEKEKRDTWSQVGKYHGPEELSSIEYADGYEEILVEQES